LNGRARRCGTGRGAARPGFPARASLRRRFCAPFASATRMTCRRACHSSSRLLLLAPSGRVALQRRPSCSGSESQAVATLWVSELTQHKLGDDGLAELTACLRPVDCQSCSRLLGADPPAVCIDDLAGLAVASLHHPRCRLPGWNESMIVVAGSGHYTTFVARMVLLPVNLASRAKEEWPLVVVNPSLECIKLELADDGRCRSARTDRWSRPGRHVPAWGCRSAFRRSCSAGRVDAMSFRSSTVTFRGYTSSRRSLRRPAVSRDGASIPKVIRHQVEHHVELRGILLRVATELAFRRARPAAEPRYVLLECSPAMAGYPTVRGLRRCPLIERAAAESAQAE
jgi:hypothetical protein